MSVAPSRFFETTRGHIVTSLRGGPRTVDELALELGLTDNAIRTHLQTLERDGLVERAGERRGSGAGKPPRLYQLAALGDELLSRAFVPLVNAVLASLDARLDPDELGDVMDDVGGRLAALYPAAHTDPTRRLAHALEVVEALGGGATTRTDDGRIEIEGRGCVIGPVVAHHPAACRAMQALLSNLLGTPATEHCDRSGGRPQCRFRLARRDGRDRGH